MKSEHLTGAEHGVVKKADDIAVNLLNAVGCDQVFVSLSNTDSLFSIGLSADVPPTSISRRHQVGDTVCGVTVAKNELFEVDDARADTALSSLPYVASGGIVGYIGLPIRDPALNPIGAICGVSSSPRKWGEADALNLRLAGSEIERLLTVEFLNRQLNEYSGALLEYDNVLLALANNLKVNSSVHTSSGHLLFATGPLMEKFDAYSLETVIASLGLAEQEQELPDFDGPNVIHLRKMMTETGRARLRTRDGRMEHWRVDVRSSSGSIKCVSWTRLGAEQK